MQNPNPYAADQYGTLSMSMGVYKYAHTVFSTAWKYVDEEHADTVGNGSLRIGTLESYALIENGRADPLDGGIEMHLTSYAARGGKRHPILEKMGFRGTENLYGAYFAELTQVILPYPSNAFCMSKIGTPFTHHKGKRQALFEVNVPGLFNYLAFKYRTTHPTIVSGEVEYERRKFEVETMEDEAPHPFIKDVKFAREREVRIYLQARNPQKVTTLETGPDPVIARLLRRID